MVVYFAFFMAIMRRHGGYAPPDNFESPKERTRRLWMEHKRRLSMEMEELEKEAVESAFQLWMANTSKTEKIELIGEGGEFWVNRPSKGSVNALRLAYKDTIKLVFSVINIFVDIVSGFSGLSPNTSSSASNTSSSASNFAAASVSTFSM